MPNPGDESSFDEILRGLEDGKLIEASADGARVADSEGTTDPGDLTQAEPAVDASGEPWLYVEWVSDDGFDYDLEVGFSDEFAHQHDTEIDDAVGFLRTLPGVRSALRQDPEQILVVGTRDALRVRDALVGWWAKR